MSRPDDDPTVQCEPAEDETGDEQPEPPASEERTPEEAGYGYGV